ncbi:MAG: sensor histidine kinase [Scytonema sp. PMC 1069.18]|nr:sensor histidine kinase [Scytonema sp. PMC 1069.18]MEC4879867.1 sensor histidine kinase [Scytonema sp. PMC 1070.18]
MQDFSELLIERSQTIVSQWIKAVAQSRQISSADGLSRSAIRNHIDQVLAALTTILAQDRESDVTQIISASLSHGKLRAAQGFDPTEIAHEYRLLRLTIRETIQAELMQGTTKEVVRAISMIDEVVDAAIAYCFESYVSERVEELTKIQQQLNLTNKELARLVKASRDNLSMLAHDIKSPLASIIGYAELFLRQQRMQQRDTVLSYEAIERIIRAGQRLLHLINDTLELSLTSDGAIKINPEQISVSELLSSTIEIMQPLAVDRGLKLNLEIENAPETVVSDPIKLQQILINLIGNSIQYTQVGSVSVTSWSLSLNQWAVSVADTGIGIASDDQLKIFNPFVRAQFKTELQPTTGSGLGLAIVEQLLKSLQGRIYVASQEGEGSTFTVILPVTLASSENNSSFCAEPLI